MRIRCAQTNVVFNDPAKNAQKALDLLQQAAQDAVDLLVLPEAFLTGYCVSSPQQAQEIALECHADPTTHEVTKAHPEIQSLVQASQKTGVTLVVGAATKDGQGLKNAALLIEPNGRCRRYAKTHLPCLGFDRFAVPGDDLPVFHTELGTLGILVCYDLRPPEATRVLALKGAQIIVLPTNWPVRKGAPPSVMVPARCAENKVYYATCNRIEDENGFSFRGDSGIYNLDGTRLQDAGPGESAITADLDLPLADQKRTEIIPGAFSTDTFNDRRPDLYGDIAKT